MFSIKNITPELSAQLSVASNLTLALVRYHPQMVIKHNRNKNRKTYPHSIGLVQSNGGDFLGTRMGISGYAPTYQNMNFTTIIDGVALGDNARYRFLSYAATNNTNSTLSYNWRDYGFAIINVGATPFVIIESSEIMRMKLMNMSIGQFANSYNVIDKKTIEIID